MTKVFNTLSRKKDTLKPRVGKKLKLFVCGITTYDLAHIGNARTYIAFDMVAKYLCQKGYEVFYLQNVTDIDDKIIQRAKDMGEDAMKLSRRFEKEYMGDMKALRVNAPTKYARATNHIKEIISQIQRLFKKGYAYEISGDGIYFDISKFKEYGKLSGRTTEQAQDAVSRIDGSVSKRNKGDFALWKYSKQGEPSWGFGPPATPRKPRLPKPGTDGQVGLRGGRGRPGWHIEDTAITEKYFGPQYDIHGGGRDLSFPHHEAEITQMESVSGKKPFVRYWMHTGFLTVKGEKMSKSLGNFVTIRDFLKEHPARLLRFFVLKTHYRSPIDYSEEILSQAQSELQRIDEFVDRLTRYSSKTKARLGDKNMINAVKTHMDQAMEDDFNTPVFIALLFYLITDVNRFMDREEISKIHTKKILVLLRDLDKYLGFIFWGREKQQIPMEIKKLAEQREQYRKQQNWSKADEARALLSQKGWTVEDTLSGPKLKQIK